MTMFSPSPMPPMIPDIEWVLARDYSMPPRNGREGFTLGKLYFERGADHICETLEDEDRRLEEGIQKTPGSSAIPTGRYRITLYQSPRHGQVVLFNAVPFFKYIEMHSANCAEELKGCVALGMERTIDGVSHCKTALSLVINELRRRTMQDRRVYCTVERA